MNETENMRQVLLVAWTDRRTGQQHSRRFALGQEPQAQALVASRHPDERASVRISWVGGTPDMERV